MFLKTTLFVAAFAVASTAYAATPEQVAQVADMVRNPTDCVEVLEPGRSIRFSVRKRQFHIIYNEKLNGLVVFGIGVTGTSIAYDQDLTGVNDKAKGQEAYDNDIEWILKGPVDCKPTV